MGKKRHKGLVIVESPAKAKKINSYLGSDYNVLASMGHICDLPQTAEAIPAEIKKEQPWTKLGVNVEADFEPFYLIPKDKEKVVKQLRSALKDADELILATDEDREGESIGWHLARILEPRVPVKRMVFSEITKEAIRDAIQNPREIDENLVAAQETRRIVDRLYGYSLSPLLWKKVAPKLSAGRVQSVAVRLLTIRELERLAFRSGTFWDLKAKLQTDSKETFEADLVSINNKKIATGKDFDETTGKLKKDADVLLLDETQARSLQARLKTTPWSVRDVEKRQQTRKPYPPFTTSTLQQEANRKLGFGARETMQVAQRLYEDGYITYMRTDSVSLSGEAIKASRRCIEQRYGTNYLSPDGPRQFTNKTKGAQEAHEAIRPAGTEMKTADELGLSGREQRLYTLIWMRTIASQMAEAQLQFQTAVIQVGDAEFRATGRHVEFPGFFRAYVEGVDDPESALDDSEASLPPLQAKQSLACEELQPLSHETKPPARYTEATLVRTLEADGIGRPSTYAAIISTIQDRGYAVKKGNQLVPSFTALAVTKLLEKYFPRLVDEAFTAKMEQTLDEIATAEAERVPYLRSFYSGEDGLDEQVKSNEEKIDPREACTVQIEGLNANIRIGRFGPYLEKIENDETLTASIPNDITPADLTNELVDELIRRKQQGPQSFGEHPETGLPMYLMAGPFGHYLQLGEKTDENPKPKRVSVPKNVPLDTLNRELAISLLQLPRTLGEHPETGLPVLAGIGRFGPYVLHQGVYKSLNKDHDVLTVDLPTAVELLKQAKARRGATPIRELGKNPANDELVAIYEGRYGAYVKQGTVNATLPKDTKIEEVTLEEALKLIAEREAKGPSKKSRGAKKAAPVKKKAAAKSDDGAPAKKKTVSAAAKKKAAPKKAAKKKTAKKKAKSDDE
ncbi:MAG: type I DNA topoisomerase [Planctomycetales bacterium]